MAVYESKGFSSILRPYKEKLEPFEYIANFSPLVVPEGADIAEYKRTQAPYCLSGKVTPEKNGTYKRNNTSLVYRDLIFLDYDEINTGIDLPKIVSDALFGYFLYHLSHNQTHGRKSPLSACSEAQWHHERRIL